MAILAWYAWKTAKATLISAQDANKQAERANEQAARANEHAALANRQVELANKQAELDSIEQTRPYVFARIVPGLYGVGSWDLRITNTGKSMARNLDIDFSDWPEDPDNICKSIKDLTETSKMLPPDSSLRVLWHLTADYTGDSKPSGMPEGELKIGYEGSSGDRYSETFSLLFKRVGYVPVPSVGPDYTFENRDVGKLYRVGQVIAGWLGELSR